MGGSSSRRTIDLLESARPNDCTWWTPQVTDSIVKIIDVYNGDCLTGLCIIDGNMRKYSLKLSGIECPDLRGRDAHERMCASFVKELVLQLSMNKICTITQHGTDKYRRILCDILLPSGHDLATILLDHKLARPYSGGARVAFDYHELEKIKNAIGTHQSRCDLVLSCI